MLNVDDVDDACQELEPSAKLGLVRAFIPVAPLADRPYRHPVYENRISRMPQGGNAQQDVAHADVG
jgi:hypothetical protein